MSETTREMTMICMKPDGTFDLVALIGGNTVVILTILLIFGFLIFFSRKLQYFLIKERAPLLALAQTIIFMLTLLVPYGVEIASYSGYSWSEPNFLRKSVKALYVVSRQLSYTMFILR